MRIIFTQFLVGITINTEVAFKFDNIEVSYVRRIVSVHLLPFLCLQFTTKWKDNI